VAGANDDDVHGQVGFRHVLVSRIM
jgi:hypothetical protein